ncbi:biotin-dependent carboxyltransferase family protein [Roseovarius sp. CAU 1744]|uniref:5-oxoprolinase subunit C family protein n=1 Tax=Roseovarius sp. CAU 1744 TaxID=3140368 RepID=UPI00325A5DF7
MTAALTVIRAGIHTSLQDLGRYGAQALGVPVSGAMDGFSLRLANALVGNTPGTGALELRGFGPSFRVEAESVRVALTGTDDALDVSGADLSTVPAGRSVTLPRGATFGIGALRDTATAYLAVAGGFEARHHFGSCATYAPAALGGFEGRALRDGDMLPLARDAAPAGADLELAQGAMDGDDGPVRVVLGPQADYFSATGIETFLSATYTVSPQNDRMGMRLEGATIEHRSGFNIPSDGVVTGSIQVPGHGLPIILLADRQTTGGYPKIATIASADLSRLARARAGTTLNFEAVSVAEAEDLHRKKEARLAALIEGLRPVGDGADFMRRLYAENLISGVMRAEY